MKATAKGGKVLKVRWAIPGSGKSGSLRLVVVAYCGSVKSSRGDVNAASYEIPFLTEVNFRNGPGGGQTTEAIAVLWLVWM